MHRSHSILALVPALLLAACANTDGGPVAGTPSYFVLPSDLRDPINPGLAPSINDYGPRPLDPEDCVDPPGYEFALVDNYEIGKASFSYTYNDSTGKVTPWSPKEWEPPSSPIPAAWGGSRCGSTRALHLAGQFKQWGAGYGTVLYNHADTLKPAGVTIFDTFSDPTGASAPTGFASRITYWKRDVPLMTPGVTADFDHPYIDLMTAADLSAWDGIAVWARRGPFAGPGFRPGLLDRTTSDDFNKQLPPEKAACRSIYTVCSCQNTKHCTPWKLADAPVGVDPELYPDRDGTYCWDPATEAYPNSDPTLRCGQTACDYRLDTPIPTMIYNPTNVTSALAWDTVGPTGAKGVGTMTCSKEPYVFSDAAQPSANYCYTPGVDADPAEKEDRCQDGFLSGTLIDTNWKRYFIPFADLRQGGVSHRSPGIDLTTVQALVFSFPAGNLDIWIDDPSFYRKKR